jgi:uncharacterized protein (DUF697 family)
MATTETQEKAESIENQDNDDREERSEKTIRNHVIASIGVGLVPIPLVDLVALSGVQTNMVRRLAKTYDIPFSQDLAKTLIASLVGGGIPVTFSRTFASLLKGVPVIGLTTGVLAMPILAGATTYALGKVFVQHFASGGTFLTFEPEKVRNYYREMFEKGKEVTSNLKKGQEKTQSAS